MYKSSRFLASLLAWAGTATNMSYGYTKIRREHPSSGCLGGYYSVEGGWRVLPYLLCLSFRLASGVPESYDVDGVALYAIDHFVQTVDDYAAIGVNTTFE